MTTTKTTSVEQLPVDQIEPHPHNPRKDVGDLTELVDSVSAHGVLQPITVVPHPDAGDRFRALMGHRRLAAAREAGLTSVPVIVNAVLDEAGQREAMLIENVHRTDLTAFEEGRAYQGLLDLGVAKVDLSRKTGRARTTIDQRLRLAGIDSRFEVRVDAHEMTLEQAVMIAEVRDLDTDTYDALAAAVDKSGHLGSWDIESALRKARHLAQYREMVAEAEKAGQKVVSEIGDAEYLSGLKIDPDEHAKCEGAAVFIAAPQTYSPPTAYPVCLDASKYHADVLEQREDAPADSAWQQRQAATEAAQAKIDEARTARHAWLIKMWSTKTPAAAKVRTTLTELVDRWVRETIAGYTPLLPYIGLRFDGIEGIAEIDLPAELSGLFVLGVIDSVESELPQRPDWNTREYSFLNYRGAATCADYTRTLIDAGYPAAEIERAALAEFEAEQAAEKKGDDK